MSFLPSYYLHQFCKLQQRVAGAAITDTPITSAIDEATAKPALIRFEPSFIAFLPIVDRLWTLILDPSAKENKSFCYLISN
jgi:hypothetical protein